MSNQYEIWSEGYIITGNAGKATLLGLSSGATFKDAVINYAMSDTEFDRYFDLEKMTFWGCALFDNELDARKRYG